MVQIVPAILATTEDEYVQKLKKIEESGQFENGWVQIDFMDNKFVQNKSIGIEIVKKYPTELKTEAQLMVIEPYCWVDDLVSAGAKRIVAPVEVHFQEVDRFLDMAQDCGVEIGLSLNPETDVDEMKPYLNRIQTILVMSVRPGFGGQKFISQVLPKIKALKDLKQDLIIGMDGGISTENAKLVVDAGADYLVVGSHLIEGNIGENLESLWEVING